MRRLHRSRFLKLTMLPSQTSKMRSMQPLVPVPVLVLVLVLVLAPMSYVKEDHVWTRVRAQALGHKRVWVRVLVRVRVRVRVPVQVQVQA